MSCRNRRRYFHRRVPVVLTASTHDEIDIPVGVEIVGRGDRVVKAAAEPLGRSIGDRGGFYSLYRN